MLSKKLLGLGLFVATGAGLLIYSFIDSAASPVRYLALFAIVICYAAGLLNHIKELKN